MTNLSTRINTAFNHLSKKEYENALIQISIAIDATAKKKWPKKKVGVRMRNFIKEYEPFIYKMATSGGLTLVSGKILILGKELPEIIYKLVRCALLHGDELSNRVIILESSNTIGPKDGKIIINVGHIYGLLLAVVIDSVNKMEFCDSNPVIQISGKSINVNELWGNLNKFQELSSLMVR